MKLREEINATLATELQHGEAGYAELPMMQAFYEAAEHFKLKKPQSYADDPALGACWEAAVAYGMACARTAFVFGIECGRDPLKLVCVVD